MLKKFNEKEVTILDLLTVNDVARMLKKSHAATIMLRVRGKLPGGIKIGRSVYWRKAQLEKYINARFVDEGSSNGRKRK